MINKIFQSQLQANIIFLITNQLRARRFKVKAMDCTGPKKKQAMMNCHGNKLVPFQSAPKFDSSQQKHQSSLLNYEGIFKPSFFFVYIRCVEVSIFLSAGEIVRRNYLSLAKRKLQMHVQSHSLSKERWKHSFNWKFRK